MITDRGLNLLGLMQILRANDTAINPVKLKELKEREIAYKKMQATQDSKRDEHKTEGPSSGSAPSEPKAK